MWRWARAMSCWAKRTNSSWAAASSWLRNRSRNSVKEFDMIASIMFPHYTLPEGRPTFFADFRSGTDLLRRGWAARGVRQTDDLGGQADLGVPARDTGHPVF